MNKIVEDMFAALNDLSTEKCAELLDDNAEFYFVKAPLIKEHYPGKNEIAKFLSFIFGLWRIVSPEGSKFTVLRYAEEGNTISVEWIKEISNSGKRALLPGCTVFELKEDKIIYFRDYFNPQESAEIFKKLSIGKRVVTQGKVMRYFFGKSKDIRKRT